jgi:hypothetical protein
MPVHAVQNGSSGSDAVTLVIDHFNHWASPRYGNAVPPAGASLPGQYENGGNLSGSTIPCQYDDLV